MARIKRMARGIFFGLGFASLVAGLGQNPGFAAEPIRIGVLFAHSGPEASIGASSEPVLRMVVERMNEEGGIARRPLELIEGDTESNPARALEEARRLCEKEKAVAILGALGEGSARAVTSYIEDVAHIPLFLTADGESGPRRWTFGTSERTSLFVEKILGWLRSRAISRVALLSAPEGFGEESRKLLRELAPKFGLEIISEEVFSAADSASTAQLAEIGERGAQALLCWTTEPKTAAAVARGLKKLGLAAPLVLAPGEPAPKYLELAGEAAEGSVTASQRLASPDQFPESSPRGAVIRAFRRLCESARQGEGPQPPDALSGAAWDAAYMLTNALREAGTDPEALKGALEGMKGFLGVGGVYNLSPEDHGGLGADSLAILTVEKGKWVLLSP